jgi:phosphohistidine phosphatase
LGLPSLERLQYQEKGDTTMKVIFLRHAEAEAEAAGSGGDEQRQLTRQGRKDAKLAAQAIGRMGEVVDAILTSPLVRARQTAKSPPRCWASKCGKKNRWPPPGNAKTLRSRLQALGEDGRQTIVIVGHSPSMEEMLSIYVALSPQADIRLGKAAAAGIEMPLAGDGKAQLEWLLKRKQLAIVAGEANA